MAVKTKTDKLVAALERGQRLTSVQISNKFGIQNPTSTIHRLRNQGVGIATVEERVRGQNVKKYTLA